MTILYVSPMDRHAAHRAIRADSRAQVGAIAGAALNRLLGLASKFGQQENEEEYAKRLMGPLTLATMPGAKPYQQMASLQAIHKLSQQHDPSFLQAMGFGGTPEGIPAGMGIQGMQAVQKFMPQMPMKYRDPLDREMRRTDIEYRRSLTREADMRTAKAMADLNDKVGQSERLQKAVGQMNEGLDDEAFQKALLGSAPAQVAMGLGVTDVDSPEFRTLRDIVEYQQKSLKEDLVGGEKVTALSEIRSSMADPVSALDILERQRHRLLEKGMGNIADEVEKQSLEWLDTLFKGQAHENELRSAFESKARSAQIEYGKEKSRQMQLTKAIASADVQPDELESLTLTYGGRSDKEKERVQAEADKIRQMRAPQKAQFQAMLDQSKRREAALLAQEWRSRRAAATGSGVLSAADEQRAQDWALAQRMLEAGSPEAAMALWQELRPGKPLPASLRFTDASTYQDALQEWLATLDPESDTAR